MKAISNFIFDIAFFIKIIISFTNIFRELLDFK